VGKIRRREEILTCGVFACHLRLSNHDRTPA
jgi:hypothetical protein